METTNQGFLTPAFTHTYLCGLTAGRNYTVTVTTISGPFAEESDPVSNATCEYKPSACGRFSDLSSVAVWGSL